MQLLTISPDCFRLLLRRSAVGTTLSHEVTKRYGPEGLPEGTIHIKLNGCASAGVVLLRACCRAACSGMET